MRQYSDMLSWWDVLHIYMLIRAASRMVNCVTGAKGTEYIKLNNSKKIVHLSIVLDSFSVILSSNTLPSTFSVPAILLSL